MHIMQCACPNLKQQFPSVEKKKKSAVPFLWADELLLMWDVEQFCRCVCANLLNSSYGSGLLACRRLLRLAAAGACFCHCWKEVRGFGREIGSKRVSLLKLNSWFSITTEWQIYKMRRPWRGPPESCGRHSFFSARVSRAAVGAATALIHIHGRRVCTFQQTLTPTYRISGFVFQAEKINRVIFQQPLFAGFCWSLGVGPASGVSVTSRHYSFQLCATHTA